MNPKLPDTVCRRHIARFGKPPEFMAYAPGRVEILGNHTDYNGGVTLSAAIDAGICAAVSRMPEPKARLYAMDLDEVTDAPLPIPNPAPASDTMPAWSKYIAGVAHGLPIGGGAHDGFELTFGGDIPRGAGLSSSAALEVACAMALAAITKTHIPTLDMARLCQRAENEFAGAKCGLLDQLSALCGVENALVAIDFQSMAANHVALPNACVFLIANTHVKHALMDSAYNDRRAQCEAAARFFADALQRPLQTLREVTLAEYVKFAGRMPPEIARRAAHVIEENQRVLDAMRALRNGDQPVFGRLMFDSHRSSRLNFENSCAELDFLVDHSKTLPQVIGARLSGGGFGGSVVVMTPPESAAPVSETLATAFQAEFGNACDIRAIKPSAGARLL